MHQSRMFSIQCSYTFFQRSFGSEDENDPLAGHQFSVFDVVENPADQWPLYSCLVIMAGLLLHFGRKIVRHVRAQAKKREEGSVQARRLT